jgi:hypothetical protein
MNKRSERICCFALAGIMAAISLYPTGKKLVTQRAVSQRLAAVEARVRAGKAEEVPIDPQLSLRVRWLAPLLASWQTVGGCGAGSSAGAGASVKWIGRSTTGGLFQTQILGSYLHLADGTDFTSGYNLSLTAQITRDLGEKWNVGVVVPYLYKYYRDYAQLPLDISNAGIGDVNLLVTRRLGPINATSLTASIGLPTGAHDTQYKMTYLTQEKQLGLGRVSGSLTLDHTIDETWGLIVLGGSGSYRGGENELGSYRAPAASLWAYSGYFMGPFVPALGLSVSHFFGHDRDRTLDQDSSLTTVNGNVSLEWSSDYLAILLGASVPYTVPGLSLDPWVVALGVTFSPF